MPPPVSVDSYKPDTPLITLKIELLVYPRASSEDRIRPPLISVDSFIASVVAFKPPSIVAMSPILVLSNASILFLTTVSLLT